MSPECPGTEIAEGTRRGQQPGYWEHTAALHALPAMPGCSGAFSKGCECSMRMFAICLSAIQHCSCSRCSCSSSRFSTGQLMPPQAAHSARVLTDPGAGDGLCQLLEGFVC